MKIAATLPAEDPVGISSGLSLNYAMDEKVKEVPHKVRSSKLVPTSDTKIPFSLMCVPVVRDR